MGGIGAVAEGLVAEFKRVLPDQRKTQRDNLALLVATMLEVRSANLMDLAAALPRAAERADMRYQWIARVLGNGLIDPDAVATMLCIAQRWRRSRARSWPARPGAGASC